MKKTEYLLGFFMLANYEIAFSYLRSSDVLFLGCQST